MSADRFASRGGQPSWRAAGRAALLAVLPLSLGACEWFTDFKDQPSVRTWESVGRDSLPTRGNPTYSIPTTGHTVPAYMVSYARNAATIDSMSGLRNPRPMSEESLRNGRMQYQINCAVCHGPAGKANGPVTQFGFPPFSLVSDRVRGFTDGFIFGVIRNGGPAGLMPSYNRIEEMDRWDIVNYIRALQGVGGFTVDTLPFGAPGQTGDLVPGATRTAPTRPAPHAVPDSSRRASAPATGAPSTNVPTSASRPGGDR